MSPLKKCVPVAKGQFPQRPAWGTVLEFVSDDDETQLPYEHETELEDVSRALYLLLCHLAVVAPASHGMCCSDIFAPTHIFVSSGQQAFDGRYSYTTPNETVNRFQG